MFFYYRSIRPSRTGKESTIRGDSLKLQCFERLDFGSALCEPLQFFV